MVKKSLFYTFFLTLSLFINSAFAADISVYVDRQNINASESFNLVFEADGSVDAAPDFSPLSIYFDILSKNQSSNMSIVNGNFSRKTVWTLVLLAKQAGTYALPAIEFGSDKSPSLNIKINKQSSTTSSADKNIFLEVEVDHSSVYVQAQLIYTVKLFRAVDIQSASLTEPELSDGDAIVEKLGDDKRYQITRNGVGFAVIERRYAIFPQQSGQLNIKPVEFKGQVVAQRRSFFDTTFNNKTKRIYSKQIDIDVKPVPSKFTNKNWLPSTELKLVDEWPEDIEFKVGEPVTRTITLISNGLTAAQLPVLAIKEISGMKQYPDQPNLKDNVDEKGIIGIRQEKIAFIPTQAGLIALPELNIAWWNTKTEKLEYARIDSKKISIAPSNSINNPTSPPIEAKMPLVLAPVQAAEESNFWFYTSIMLLLAWLSTLALLFKPDTDKKPATVNNPKKTNTKNLSKKFASACHLENKSLCKSLLIEWASQQWPETIFNTLDDVALMLSGDLLLQVKNLNQQLYSKGASVWDSSALLTSFNNYKGKPVDNSNKNAIPLKKLNKLV